MINIFRKIIVLFSSFYQILLRIGLTRGEKHIVGDRIEKLEDAVDDKEEEEK